MADAGYSVDSKNQSSNAAANSAAVGYGSVSLFGSTASGGGSAKADATASNPSGADAGAIPIWVWIGGGVAVLVIGFLLFKRKS